MGMDKETRIHCMGGCSFLHLAIGIFVLVPSMILLGIYADNSWIAEKYVAVILFSLALLILVIGTAMCVYWCTQTKVGGELKDPEDAQQANDKPGGTSRSSVPKTESNGAALSDSAAKYESQAPDDASRSDVRSDTSLPKDSAITSQPVLA